RRLGNHDNKSRRCPEQEQTFTRKGQFPKPRTDVADRRHNRSLSQVPQSCWASSVVGVHLSHMNTKAVYLETFGCQMNELDSELVAGSLSALGYTFTPNQDEADIVLYNTCSVRERAEQKVWSRLGEMKTRKNEQPDLVVGVLGCMAERDGADLI